MQQHKTIANYFCKIVGKLFVKLRILGFGCTHRTITSKKKENETNKAAFEILLRGAPLVAQRLCDLACAACRARVGHFFTVYENPWSGYIRKPEPVRLPSVGQVRWNRLEPVSAQKAFASNNICKKSVRLLGHDSGY